MTGSDIPAGGNLLVRLWRGDAPAHRAASLVLVLLLAAAVRLAAARVAYPAPGDVFHFAQIGAELATGNLRAWTTVWSPGPMLLAWAASAAGLWAPRVLQVVSLAAGVVAVAGAMFAAFRLLGRWPCALVAGLLAATNPSLVYYSVGGWGEMPYMACLLLAVWLFSGRREDGAGCAAATAGAFALLGVGAYFRPLEAHFAAGLLAFWILVHGWGRRRSRVFLHLAVSAVVFALTVLPIYLITYRVTGRFSPGTKTSGIVLGVLGDATYDSKLLNRIGRPQLEAMRVEYEQKGLVRYLWDHKAEFARGWKGNMGHAARSITAQVLTGPFRLGPGWLAGLLVAAGLRAVGARRVKPWLIAVSFVVVPISLMSVSSILDRYIAQVLPFLFILLADLTTDILGRFPIRRAGALAVAVLAGVFLVKSSTSSVALADETDWPYWNGARVAEAIARHGGATDVIMTQQFSITLHLPHACAINMINLPYGSIDETEAYARERGVTMVAISSRLFSHWPINALFHGTPPPPNWVLLEDRTFSRITRFGVEEERYLLFRRDPDGGVRR